MKKALKVLNDVLQRANPVQIYQSGNRLSIFTARSTTLVLEVDRELWGEYLRTVEKPPLELKTGVKNYEEHLMRLNCASGVNSSEWNKMEEGELFAGKKIDIFVDEVGYPVTLNKTMIGIVLRKSEYVNISYRVKTIEGKLVLSIKKEFPPLQMRNKEVLPGTGFVLVTSWQLP